MFVHGEVVHVSTPDTQQGMLCSAYLMLEKWGTAVYTIRGGPLLSPAPRMICTPHSSKLINVMSALRIKSVFICYIIYIFTVYQFLQCNVLYFISIFGQYYLYLAALTQECVVRKLSI